MRMKSLGTTWTVVLLLLIALAIPASADVKLRGDYTRVQDEGLCVYVSSEISHGSSNKGYSKGVTQARRPTYLSNGNHINCGLFYTQAVNELRVTMWLMKKDPNSTKIVVCTALATVTNSSAVYQQTATYHYTSNSSDKCGRGDYSTHTLGQVLEGQTWYGGNTYMNSGNHFLPV